MNDRLATEISRNENFSFGGRTKRNRRTIYVSDESDSMVSSQLAKHLIDLFSDRDSLTQKGKQHEQHKHYHGYTLRTIDRCSRAGSFHCNYCAATHSQIAKTLLRTLAEVIAAVRNNTPVPDAKLNALVGLVRELVRERGYAKENTIQRFLAAGYTKEQVRELLLGIALKTISNYLDHISPAPLDHSLAGESK
jgi:hypothetical protein